MTSHISPNPFHCLTNTTSKLPESSCSIPLKTFSRLRPMPLSMVGSYCCNGAGFEKCLARWVLPKHDHQHGRVELRTCMKSYELMMRCVYFDMSVSVFDLFVILMCPVGVPQMCFWGQGTHYLWFDHVNSGNRQNYNNFSIHKSWDLSKKVRTWKSIVLKHPDLSWGAKWSTKRELNFG